MSGEFSFGRLVPGRRVLLWGAVILNTELLLVLVYLLTSGVGVIDPLFYAWPFIWVNAAIWAVWTVRLPATGPRARLGAGVLAGGYLIVLGYFGGLFTLHGSDVGLRLALDRPPGWGPALIYGGSAFTIALTPFKVIGYAALSYLVAATILDTAGSAWTGLLGLLSCVSCSWPIIATILSGVLGSASAVGALALEQAYPLSTLAYLSAVALLVWRPRLGSRLVPRRDG